MDKQTYAGSTGPVRRSRSAPGRRPPAPADLLGAHMSVAGGFDRAIDRALAAGCTAMQIFVKNNMQWFAPPLRPAQIAAFADHPQRSRLRAVFGHAGYLINLAASDPATHARSLRSLAEELLRADALGLPFLVLHPGAHTGAGVEAGLERVARSIDRVYAAHPAVATRLALEITAGQGTCLGHRFEHLAAIIARVREPDRLRVCLDTAHLFAAGYDLGTAAGCRATLRAFDRVIGRDRLVAWHLNDSKTACGSRVDRHEHIGRGRIGLDAFREIMRAERFRAIPKVLETPKGTGHAADRANLRTLRQLAARCVA